MGAQTRQPGREPSGSSLRSSGEAELASLVESFLGEESRTDGPRRERSASSLGRAWEQRMRGDIRRSRGCEPSSARVGWRRPEVVEYEVGHVAP
jgi:hypothetical protein